MQDRGWSKQNNLRIGGQLLYDEIKRNPPSTSPYEDKCVWKFDMEGISLTKTAYSFLMTPKLPDSPWKGWKRLWRLYVPPKMKIFGWKLLYLQLPTTSYLVKLNICNTSERF